MSVIMVYTVFCSKILCCFPYAFFDGNPENKTAFQYFIKMINRCLLLFNILFSGIFLINQNHAT